MGETFINISSRVQKRDLEGKTILRRPQQVLPHKTLVLEIDLTALTDNYQATRAFLSPHCNISGVLKTNGYGLGMIPLGQTLWAAGCRQFFVAYVDEGIELRQALPTASIAILSGVLPETEEIFYQYRLTPVLTDSGQVNRWQQYACRVNQKLSALLHIDTGMARNGLSVKEGLDLAKTPTAWNGLNFEYIMSHLVSSEISENPLNNQQLTEFNALRKWYPHIKASLSNSSGLSLGSDYQLDLVRPGIGLLGYAWPFIPHFKARPTVRALSRVVQIQYLAEGRTMGYNASYRCDRPTRLATLGLGYRDGFFWRLSNRGVVWFGAYPAPVLGRVSMDFTLVDITDIPEEMVHVGSWALLFDTFEKLDKLARQADTFHYELLTSLGTRYDRQYLTEKDVV